MGDRSGKWNRRKGNGRETRDRYRMTTTVDLYIVKIFWEKNLTGPYRSFSTCNYSDANRPSTRLHLGYRSVPVQGRAWLRLTPSPDPLRYLFCLSVCFALALICMLCSMECSPPECQLSTYPSHKSVA